MLMTSIVIDEFGGMMPRYGEQELPQHASSDAENCLLLSGELRPLRKPQLIANFYPPPRHSGSSTVISCGEIIEVGTGFSILDGQSEESTIVVSEDCAVLTVAIVLNMHHEFLGDLVCTLKGPNGETAPIFHRAGATPGPPNAGYPVPLGVHDTTLLCIDLGFCDPPQFADYEFSDTGSNLWIAAEDSEIISGGIGFTFEDLVPGNYYAMEEWTGGYPPQFYLNTLFGGISASGSWTLTLGDELGNHEGVLNQWTLKINEGL
jgi:hypothetical protein